MYKYKNGFSIVIALGFMILMSSIGLYLLEYMIPFSRNIKGIENASKSYYQSYWWLEDALLYSYSWWIGSSPSNILSWSIDYWYRVFSSGTLIPQTWEWNSEYDSDWNKISQTNTIQLVIWNNRLISWGSRIQIRLRVPDFDLNWSPDVLDTTPDDDLILWQLSSNTNSISTANGELIQESDIDGNIINLWTTTWFWLWVLLDWSSGNFSNFYTSNCGVWNECVLKISVINLLESSADWQLIPYLEYQLTTSNSIPLQYADIESIWQSVSFRKSLEISVLQQNTNAAFDFAIFQ